MAFTETLDALGTWDLELADDTPDELVAQLNFYGHVVIVDGLVDDVPGTGNALLAAARYVGVCRAKAHPGSYTRSGSGMLHWISDEDGKNWFIESAIVLASATLAQVVTALLPPTVTVGTVFAQADPAVRYTGTHIFQSRRDALAVALAPFGAELRVNGNFTVDVGTPAQLYDTTLPLTSKPSPMIVRRGAGSDLDLVAVGGKVDTEGAVWDYSSRVLLLGQTIGTGGEPDTVFATGAADAPSVPYKDPQGNPVKMTRPISESGTTTGTVAARAQLQLNRFNRETTAVKVTADDYEISGGFGVGDAAYVYDPDSGIFDTAQQVLFRGQPIHPQIIRVTSLTTPIVAGMTVAWRTDAGVWLDLTRWIVWESAGSREITVGDLPKTLSKPSDPIQDRVDAARGNPSSKAPKVPTGLALTTSSTANANGRDSSVITASWDPVTQYSDSTSVALSHYEVQYRPQFRSPLWTGSTVTTDLTTILAVTAALGYDVQVRAVSTGGVVSAWSSTVSIISAADSTGPATPSDPVVTQYLGLLRIYWNGLNSVGGPMPSDFNRVDVHVGTSSGFTASAATLVSSLSVAGYAHAQAPYGSTRWVRFIAYDHNGNPSASSAVISGATVQAADGDVAALSVGKLTAGILSADVTVSGRVTTALTGARREMNALGFQAYDAANNLIINLDGVNNLLTGIFQTALPGNRRVVIGAAGALGEIDFYAPDGTLAYIRAYTESTGIEAMQFGVPMAGGDNFWNKIHFNSDEWMNLHANKVDLTYLNGGFFIVRQTSARTGGTITNRLQIDNGGLTIRDQANTTRHQVTSTDTIVRDAAGTSRAQVAASSIVLNGTDGFFRVKVSDTILEVVPGSSAVTNGELIYSSLAGYGGSIAYSPFTKFQTNAISPGTGVFAGGLFFAITNGGVQANFSFVDGANSNYVGTTAANFTVGSDRATKEAIVDAPGGFLTEIESMLPRKYRRKPPVARRRGRMAPGRDGGPEWVDEGPDTDFAPPEMPEEIGFVAQELPARFVVDTHLGKAVDLYQLVVAAIGGVQELSAIVKKGRAA